MRQDVKSVLWFGLTIDAVIIGGSILARVFYNEAPARFHQFVALSLWVTIAAGLLGAALIFRISRTLKQLKAARSNAKPSAPPRKPAAASPAQNNLALLGVLIMSPPAFIIFPLVHGAAAFGHDYLRLIREGAVFLALWFCFKIHALTKKSLRDRSTSPPPAAKS